MLFRSEEESSSDEAHGQLQGKVLRHHFRSIATLLERIGAPLLPNTVPRPSCPDIPSHAGWHLVMHPAQNQAFQEDSY